jgi:hypothetical protein
VEQRKTDIQSLKDEKLQKEFQWKKSEGERLKQERSQNEKRGELKGLFNDFTFIAHKLQNVEMQAKSQREMNRNLGDQLHEKKVILENMEKEKAELENKLINTEEEINIVTGKTRDLEIKLLIKEQTIKSLRESCNVYEDEIQAKVKEIERLTKRIRELEEDMQVKETLSLKLKNENCDPGKNLQEKDSEIKELRGENVKLMAMTLIKKRDHLEEEENELSGNVSKRKTRKFDAQLMRKVQEFQGPRYENTDFAIHLKMKVEELMELAGRKKIAEEGLLAKQSELQKLIDDNMDLIERIETSKSTTSFRAQNLDVYGGKQNEKTNVGNNRNDNDPGEEFRNESAVSKIDNCQKKARKVTELINVKTGIWTDAGQTEIQNTTSRNIAAGNEIHADREGMQHSATAIGIKRPEDERQGKGNFRQDRIADSSDTVTGLQVKDTTGLMQGESKRSSAHNARSQNNEETTFLKQQKPHSVGDLKRFPTVQRHVSLDTGFDSVTKKRNMMMSMEEGKTADGKSENSKLRKQLSISRTELQSVADGSKGRVVL